MEVAGGAEMNSRSSPARNATGVSEKDILAIKQHARRRRMTLLLTGGIGTVAALVAGYLSARRIYCESRSDESTYPFAAPLLVSGIAGRRYRFGVVGVAASIAAAFILMFVLTMIMCAPETQSTYYGVWGRVRNMQRTRLFEPMYEKHA